MTEKIHTLDRLLSKEIMLHDLDIRAQLHSPSLCNNIGKILKHKATRGTRPLASELGKIMTHAATNIDKEHIFPVNIGE